MIFGQDYTPIATQEIESELTGRAYYRALPSIVTTPPLTPEVIMPFITPVLTPLEMSCAEIIKTSLDNALTRRSWVVNPSEIWYLNNETFSILVGEAASEANRIREEYASRGYDVCKNQISEDDIISAIYSRGYQLEKPMTPTATTIPVTPYFPYIRRAPSIPEIQPAIGPEDLLTIITPPPLTSVIPDLTPTLPIDVYTQLPTYIYPEPPTLTELIPKLKPESPAVLPETVLPKVEAKGFNWLLLLGIGAFGILLFSEGKQVVRRRRATSYPVPVPVPRA